MKRIRLSTWHETEFLDIIEGFYRFKFDILYLGRFILNAWLTTLFLCNLCIGSRTHQSTQMERMKRKVLLGRVKEDNLYQEVEIRRDLSQKNSIQGRWILMRQMILLVAIVPNSSNSRIIYRIMLCIIILSMLVVLDMEEELEQVLASQASQWWNKANKLAR